MRGPAERIRTFAAVLVIVMTCGAGTAGALTTEQLLDEIQHRAFDYFWNEASASHGLVKDRSAAWSPGKMAATGFGMSAICIGIDRGWISREAGRERILTALQTLWTGPQGPEPSGNLGYKGFYYHFVDLDSDPPVRTWDCDLAPIDTALLFAGIIDAREYFSTDDPVDVELRGYADWIVHRADWGFMYDGLGISLTWTPEDGFPPVTWLGMNEAMIMYILALGSPTHPIPAASWDAWTSNYDWSTHYGYSYVTFPPLFGHQYSHCWIDFRSIQDAYMRNRGIDYFENSRRATLANREYCAANPGGFAGYGDLVWGITAGDGPDGYAARGAPPAQNDDGTITVTAAASSITFAPEVVIPTLHHFYDEYGDSLWGIYGFRDGFNLDRSWWASDYIGIDLGPMILMIENYRTGAVWDRFMRNADVRRGLERAGFGPVTGVGEEAPPERGAVLHPAVPNPFRTTSVITYELPRQCEVSLTLYDLSGRPVRTLVRGPKPPGAHAATVSGEGLSDGIYFFELRAGGSRRRGRLTLLQ